MMRFRRGKTERTISPYSLRKLVSPAQSASQVSFMYMKHA